MMLVVESDGGHNGFDQTAEETGFDYLVQEKKRNLENKGFNGDIQQEALFLSLPIYKKRHEMNKAYWTSELQRETETETQYEIRFNEERQQYEMYHPEYETYLQDMLARTERYAKEKNQPHVFNKDESDSIIQAERSLIGGVAKSILYPVWHESGKVRYVVEMTVDGTTIRNRYIDVGKIAGNDLSQKEALSLFYMIGSQHESVDGNTKQHSSSYPMLFFKNDEVGFGEIANTAHDHVRTELRESHQESRETQYISHGDTEYEGKSYLQDQRVGEHGLRGTLQTAEQLYKEKFVPFILHKREMEKQIALTKNNEQKKKDDHKDVHRVVARIESLKENMIEKKKGIIFAAASGVGIGGAIFMLDTLKKPSHPISKKEKQELKRFMRLNGNELRIQTKRKVRMKNEHTFLTPLVRDKTKKTAMSYLSERVSLRKTEKKRKRHSEKKALKERKIKRKKQKETKAGGVKETTRQRSTSLGNIIFSLKEGNPTVGAKEKRKKEKSGFSLKETDLLHVLEKITKRIQQEKRWARKQKEPGFTLRKKESQDGFDRKKISRVYVLEFIKTWIIFSLLRQSFNEYHISTNKEPVFFKKKLKKEEQSIYESLPLVLLSIIWYMTMLREQGKTIALPKKKKKKKKKMKKKHVSIKTTSMYWISQQGVIYAYP